MRMSPVVFLVVLQGLSLRSASALQATILDSSTVSVSLARDPHLSDSSRQVGNSSSEGRPSRGAWFDVQDFGAHPRGDSKPIKVNTVANSTIVTLVGGKSDDFEDGEGIDIVDAGPNTTQTINPSAPEIVSPAISGSTKYTYQCVGADSGNGLVPGIPGVLADGPDSFAPTPLSNESISRVSNVLTIDVKNNFKVGTDARPTIVIVQGAVPQDLDGEYVIASATPTTITAITGMMVHGKEIGTTPGTSMVYPVVIVKCPDINQSERMGPDGKNIYELTTVQYAVYGNSSGRMQFISMTPPAANEKSPDHFSSKRNEVMDWGPFLSQDTVPPAGIPTLPPDAPTRQVFQGRIVSGGGTSQFVVSPAIPSAVSGAFAFHDDGPGILAAATVAKASVGGTVFLSPSKTTSKSGAYEINYPLNLPDSINFIFGDALNANATITFGRADSLTAVLGSEHSSFPQFSQRSYAAISGFASPQIFFPENGDLIDGLGFSTLSNHQISLFVTGSQQTISNSTFYANQTLSTSVVFQGPSAALHLANVAFLDFSSIPWPGPTIPALWFRSDYNVGMPNMVTLDGVNSFSYRGILLDMTGANLSSEVNYRFDVGEDQAPSTPLLMFYGAGYIQNVSLYGAIMDSTPAPAIGNWSSNVNNVKLNDIVTSAQAPQVTGLPIGGLSEDSSRPGTFPLGQNFDFLARLVAPTNFGKGGRSAWTGGELLLAQPLILDNEVAYPFAVAYPSPVLNLEQSTGGSLVEGQHYEIAVAVVGPNGGTSAPEVRGITIDPGENAILARWNCVPNAFGYDIFINGSRINNQPLPPNSQSFLVRAPANYGQLGELAGTGMPLVDNSGIYAPTVKAQKLGQVSASQFAGVGVITGGVFRFSFPSPYRLTPVCVSNDLTRPMPVQPEASPTSLTVRGVDGDRIAFLCVGNPD
jgi:hypothetical protein